MVFSVRSWVDYKKNPLDESQVLLLGIPPKGSGLGKIRPLVIH